MIIFWAISPTKYVYSHIVLSLNIRECKCQQHHICLKVVGKEEHIDAVYDIVLQPIPTKRLSKYVGYT